MRIWSAARVCCWRTGAESQVSTALHGEQQRPGQMFADILTRPGRAARTAVRTAFTE